MKAVVRHEEKLTRLETTSKDIASTIELQEKMADLEDRSRRNNFIVFGITESDNETTEQNEKKVPTDVFRERLKVNVTSAERIHRLGRKQEGKTRPVIIRVFDYKEKVAVFKNCRKLKGTGIAVSDDFCGTTLRKRKKLWESTKAERDRGLKVRLTHDKIVIDNELYVWNDAQSRRIKIGKESTTPRESD